MNNTPDSPFRRHAVRFSRTINLARAVALGSSIAVSLGVFILAGTLLENAGAQAPQTYLLAIVAFVPLLLTCAERAEVAPVGGGLYGLIRLDGSTWRTYAGGWLLLGGFLALIAVLGRGAAFYLEIVLISLFDIQIDSRWMAPGIVVVATLNELLGTRSGWRIRALFVYMALLFLLVLAVASWFSPGNQPNTIEPIAAPGVSLLTAIAPLAAILWSVQVVLDRREELRQPERTVFPALLLPIIFCGIIGAVVVAAELRLGGQGAIDRLPLLSLNRVVQDDQQTLLDTIYLLLGLAVCLGALDRAIVAMLRLAGTMVRDGFMPERLLAISPSLGTPLVALRIVAVLSAIGAAFVPRFILVELAALALLWTAVLLTGADIPKRELRLPAERRLKLPLQPLFPLAATGISLVLSFALVPVVLIAGAGWALAGLAYYLVYARQGGTQVRRRDTLVSTGIIEQRKAIYTVLVGIANPATASALIHAGAALARPRQGRVLVLRVATFPDQVPQHIQRQEALEDLQDLERTCLLADQTDVPIELMVRLAHNPAEGILATSQEEKADLILLGWQSENTSDQYDLDPVMDPVVRTATCGVAVLRGQFPEQIERVLVPTAGSPNSLAAMKLGQQIVDPESGQVVALHLVQEVFSPTTMEERHKQLQDIINTVGGTPRIEPCVEATDGVKSGILRVAQNFDMVLLGASHGGILDQTIFGGRPVEVARQSERPVLLVKHYEGARRFWVRRAWEIISGPFPKLTLSERNEIYDQLRRTSHPGIDFFILICLSAMIAVLGLLLGSPAVIIGAMLVAPLMSPILGIAMAMVQGDLRLLRFAMMATLSGVALAIGVATGITLLTPTRINTIEILSRTRPNLLDLLVALASGAAGGYAVARKEVAAALPGVAIAAALVPPLGVIGYGIATGQVAIAGGSLLLFTTNLIAIVVAAAFVYLLLGFRPTQARMRQIVQIKFVLSLVALLLVSIPLALFSVNIFGQITSQNRVEAFLSQEMQQENLLISDVMVDQRDSGYLITMTIYIPEAYNFSEQQLETLQTQLSEAIEAPVTLEATVLRAVHLPDHERNLLPEPTTTP